MVALADAPAPTAPRVLRTPRLAVEDAALPAVAPPPGAAAAVWPVNDRLPLAKKVHILAERGLWPALEAVAREHGWHSVEVACYIDAQIPKRACPICGTPFYAYSRRVKYCKNECRRKGAAAMEYARNGGGAPKALAVPSAPRIPASEPLPLAEDDQCVWLAGKIGGRRRFYLCLVVQDLFGAIALVRQWGADDTARPQQAVTTYATLAEAQAALVRFAANQVRRGYRRSPLAKGRGDLLRRAYAVAGCEARG